MNRFLLAAILGAVLHPSSAPAQQTATPQQSPPPSQREEKGMEGMPMDNMPTIRPELPRFGRAQENPSARLIQLKDLEQMALEKNPTLLQANAEIRAAKARQQQSGLYPNPKAGYAGEEIRGGSFGGGEQGFFVSQSLVTAGKLGLNRRISGQDVRIAEMEAQEQQLRVLNGVRVAYYHVLAAQEMLDTKQGLARIAAETVKTTRELQNIGQVDQSELLQAEVDQQRAEMNAMMQQNTLRQEWRALAAAVGNPDLAGDIVAGDLDKDLLELDERQAIEALLHDSPSVAIAQAGVDRAEAVLGRARREPIPDIEVRVGMLRSGEFLEPTNRPAGLMGFAEVGVQLAIFNRNQGNVQAAHGELERARAETKRVELILRERSAAVLDLYRNSQIMVSQYRNQLLPRAQKAYELLVEKYGLMSASYPEVLKAQHALFQLHAEYIAALEGLWVNGLTLKGLLLTDGLESPVRPGEVDLPVRDINVPVPQPQMSGSHP